MPKRIEFNGQVHEFPDDFTDADIAAALDSGGPPTSQQSTTPMGGWLPTAGGMVGSLVGTAGGALLTPLMGPAGIMAGRTLGAGLGGALGKGAEMFLDDKPDSFSDVASQMGGAGLQQGGAELAGGMLGKAVGKFAPRLMQSALKPSKAIRNEFGNVAETAVKRGIPISKGGERKVGKLIEASANKTNAAISQAQNAGARPIAMQDVVPSLQAVAQKVAKEPLDAGAKLQDISDIGGRLLQQHPNPIPLTEAQAMKQAAQRVATQGYKAVNAGNAINSVTPDANMAIARGLREQIEQRVPSVAGLNAETQGLMGVERSLEDALGRISNNQPIGMNALIASGVGGGAYAASGDPGLGGGVGLGIMALTNPYLASRLAIGAGKAAPAIGQLPNAARAAALLQALSEQEQ